MTFNRLLAGTLALVLVSGLVSPAFADLVAGMEETTLGTMSPQAVGTQQACNDIDYTFTGTGSGSLGATNFVDSDFTVRVWSNTCDVMEIFTGVFTVRALMADVEVDGVGTATVTEETGVFANNGNGAVGWSEFSGDFIVSDIYDLFNVLPPAYDLMTDFGPVFDFTPMGFFDPVSTDAGIFNVNSPISDGSFMAQLKQKPVGGELLPIDSTALVLAGIQTSAIWMLPVLAGAVGVGAYYIKTRMNKE